MLILCLLDALGAVFLIFVAGERLGTIEHLESENLEVLRYVCQFRSWAEERRSEDFPAANGSKTQGLQKAGSRGEEEEGRRAMVASWW